MTVKFKGRAACFLLKPMALVDGFFAKGFILIQLMEVDEGKA